MPLINGVDFNGITSMNGVSWNSISNIGGVPVSHGSTSPYRFYYARTSLDVTGVTNTTEDTILTSVIIPAGTFELGGVLECIYRIRKFGSTTAYTWRIYTNTADTLDGATILAQGVASTSVNLNYNETLRYFSLDGDTIKYLGNLGNQTDIGFGVTSASTMGITTFNLFEDNYIIYSVQPANAVSDIIYEDTTFIRGYE